ncbi:MAG: hypothetical protein H7A18_03230 [Sinobacteraceae bacterium]|nr:hypothetical protein [Anaerolineae bacterium]MCP5471084.1 hypothetical protein [Nevskiaceae bacterium]
MKPDMSFSEMLDSFIYIARGSCVIDRRDRDWALAAWQLSEKYIRQNYVYRAGDLRRYFAHRVVKSKWASDRCDPFNDWLTSPHKFTVATLADAIKLADAAARGQVEPRMDIDSFIKNTEARAAEQRRSLPPWVVTPTLTPPVGLIAPQKPWS